MSKKAILTIITISLFSIFAQAEYVETRSNNQLGDKKGFVDTHTIEGKVFLQTDSSLGDNHISLDGATKIFISGSVAEHIWMRALLDGENTKKDKYGNDTLYYRGWFCSATLPSSANSIGLNLAIRFDHFVRNTDGYINCSKSLLD